MCALGELCLFGRYVAGGYALEVAGEKFYVNTALGVADSHCCPLCVVRYAYVVGGVGQDGCSRGEIDNIALGACECPKGSAPRYLLGFARWGTYGVDVGNVGWREGLYITLTDRQQCHLVTIEIYDFHLLTRLCLLNSDFVCLATLDALYRETYVVEGHLVALAQELTLALQHHTGNCLCLTFTVVESTLWKR